MAVREVRELYSGVMIDVGDMTMTEYGQDECKVYHLLDILERWDGVQGVQIEIKKSDSLCDGGYDG